jgi:hypothetical protein
LIIAIIAAVIVVVIHSEEVVVDLSDRVVVAPVTIAMNHVE